MQPPKLYGYPKGCTSYISLRLQARAEECPLNMCLAQPTPPRIHIGIGTRAHPPQPAQLAFAPAAQTQQYGISRPVLRSVDGPANNATDQRSN